MRKVFIAASLLALASSATPLMAQDAPALSTQSQAMLEDLHDRYAFPGATPAIALPNGTIVTAATGLADVKNARAMTPETPMLAASIGKSLVAATVLALESEESLSRADLLSAHLGDRPWFTRPN
jgi:D-alanyl-D-alanine carboxypeptidase